MTTGMPIILTIEDPIEFVHTGKKCLINQREVHKDTLSFGAALRLALREDPDVILVGEIRDLKTIRLALTAAETRHLVLVTLHTGSAYEIMIATPAIRNLIREGKVVQIYSAIQTGQAFGMRTLDRNLRDLLGAGLVTGQEAEFWAWTKDSLL